jgi:hypothetical protein
LVPTQRIAIGTYPCGRPISTVDSKDPSRAMGRHH